MKTKLLIKLFIVFWAFIALTFAQTPKTKEASAIFWDKLQTHCGKAYSGKLTLGPEESEFRNTALVMHVKSCSDTEIKIPFFVGDNLSRTWILRLDENNILQLKHDHRHKDGTQESISFYGGKSTNTGHENFQFFPADFETAAMIPEASSNVWWIELTDDQYSYNLRRLASMRAPFRVEFDLKNPIALPVDPWGWDN